MRPFVQFAISVQLAWYSSLALPAACDEPVRLAVPSQEDSKRNITRASGWLVDHVVHGSINAMPDLGTMTLLAWHDPSLSTNTNDLAAYAITDSLWASRALAIHHAAESEAIHKSLVRLDCLENNLHEVLFQKLTRIHHRSADDDPVHGRLIGTMQFADKAISVRSFRMKYDADYSIGHPALFAEHAVYQSLFDYWNGDVQAAHDRIRSVFDYAPTSPPPIFWDREHTILVDHVTSADYRRFIGRDATRCRQYTFKLALIIYAVRLMGVDLGDNAILEHMQETVTYIMTVANFSRVTLRVQNATSNIGHCPDVRPHLYIC